MQVVRACLVLHNYLMTKKDKNYSPPGFMDTEDSNANVVQGSWRNSIDNQQICTLRADPSLRPSTSNAREIRDNLKEYFYDEGAVEFQWKMIE